MREEIEKKLESEIETASWDMLIDHHERGAVFITSPNITLVSIAAAIAVDDVELVSIALKNGDFAKVTDEDQSQYAKNPKEKIFDFIIVQPYVLIKRKDNN